MFIQDNELLRNVFDVIPHPESSLTASQKRIAGLSGDRMRAQELKKDRHLAQVGSEVHVYWKGAAEILVGFKWCVTGKMDSVFCIVGRTLQKKLKCFFLIPAKQNKSNKKIFELLKA
ncbi:hypothetical protein KFK09_009223 [Dendrobium nobile]|uniref:Uncharacterized protein n=1 Tax=Dendrobium nobile TaxID=94219 RepID=A0A8T3BRS7_DENNO|nr:hypothetical protein KFK09_009223 [Dendrobium nobile]